MIENDTWYRCTICGREGLVGRCCGDETREPLNELAKMEQSKITTDKELYREVPGDYYSPSLHVTIDSLIGINVGGSVHVMSLRDWHKRAESFIVKTETTAYNSGYMVWLAKAILAQIAKAASYIRKRCTTLKKRGQSGE